MEGGKGMEGGREGRWKEGRGMEGGKGDRIGMEEGRGMKVRKRDVGRKMDGRKGEGWRTVSGSEEGVLRARRRGWSWALVAVHAGERSACPRSRPRH